MVDRQDQGTSEKRGVLYLVATPLGNLGDLSPRAREVLGQVSRVAAESRDSARRLLAVIEPDQEPGWSRPRILSYREGSREQDEAQILQALNDGASVALVSDAGTPTVSDPGWHLVDRARTEGVEIQALPGPCAAINALVLSGFPSRQFRFEGFLPKSGKKREEALSRIDAQTCPVIIYEAPHRLLQTLTDFSAQLKPRDIFVVREMTKKFEEGWRGMSTQAPSAWAERRIQGEFTLVLGPKNVEESAGVDVSDSLLSLVRELPLSTRDSVRLLRHLYPQLNKRELYELFT